MDRLVIDREPRDALAALADLSGPLPVRSHRPLVGSLVVGIKRGILALARRALSPVLERQERFNREVAARLGELDGANRRLVGPPVDPETRPDLPTARRIEVVHESLHREIDSREAALLRTIRDEIAVKTSQALATVLAESAATRPLTEAWSDHLYREFVTRFRGSEDEIRRRFELYADLLTGSAPVLDVGCGRGELLALLRERGIAASGVDSNAELVQHCVAAGLEVTHGDGLERLRGAAAGSLGAVFSAQVLEHLEPEMIHAFLVLAHRALRPGGLLVAETVNAECLSAITSNYFADWTHHTPLAPRTLRFVAERAGFGDPEIRYLSPVPEAAKLQVVAVDPDLPSASRDPLEAINRNFALLNALLFGAQDFALIARKPG